MARKFTRFCLLLEYKAGKFVDASGSSGTVTPKLDMREVTLWMYLRYCAKISLYLEQAKQLPLNVVCALRKGG